MRPLRFSSEDILKWETERTIMAKSDHLEKTEYQADHLPQASYYRLKIIDKSGTYKYADIISPDCDISKSQLTIVPNPTHGKTQINFQVEKLGKYDFTVFDLQGKIIYHDNRSSDANSIEINYNSTDLVPGSYYVHINTGQALLVKKMIVF